MGNYFALHFCLLIMPQMYHLKSSIIASSLHIFWILIFSQSVSLAQGLTNNYPSPPEEQIEAARILYNDSKFEDAYQAYNAMLLNYPDNGEVLFGLALTTEALKDYDQALIYYNLLVHYEFELPEIYMNRGKIRFTKKQYEAALEDFIKGELVPIRETRMVQFKGWKPSESSATQLHDIQTSVNWVNEFKEWKAKSLLKLERYEEALLYYQELISSSPENSTYLVERADIFLAKADIDSGFRDLKNALIVNPSNEQAKFNLLQLSTEDVTENDLLRLYEEILTTSPNIAEVLMNKGILHYKQGDYLLALENLNDAIALDPEKGIYYFNRSLVLSKLERYSEAINNLLDAVNFQPDHAPSWAALGNNQIELENYPSAIEAFQLALFYDSTNPIYHFNRAVAFQKSDKIKEACSDFRIAANMGLQEAQEMTIKLCGVKN
jgi:tetratricopeptide (TPR) repeat protein